VLTHADGGTEGKTNIRQGGNKQAAFTIMKT